MNVTLIKILQADALQYYEKRKEMMNVIGQFHISRYFVKICF